MMIQLSLTFGLGALFAVGITTLTPEAVLAAVAGFVGVQIIADRRTNVASR